jgi:hypothetical protein
MNLDIFILLIAFQFKHLLADYYWQFPCMYLNKGAKEGWFEPLLSHAVVHAGLTAILLALLYNYKEVSPTIEHKLVLIIAVIFDLVTHFITDRWKATRGRTPDEPKFWTDLGIDQMIHHIVGIVIVFFIYIYI